MKEIIIDFCVWFFIGASIAFITLCIVLKTEAHGEEAKVSRNTFDHLTKTVDHSGPVKTDAPVLITGIRLSSKFCKAIIYDGVEYKYTIPPEGLSKPEEYFGLPKPISSLTVGILGVGETPGKTCEVEIDYFPAASPPKLNPLEIMKLVTDSPASAGR